jgi:hypothetical protein
LGEWISQVFWALIFFSFVGEYPKKSRAIIDPARYNIVEIIKPIVQLYAD